MYERILVASDGSELAERGVDAGIELAKKTGGELFFVTVTSLMPSYSMTVGAEWAASPGTFEDYRHEMESGAKTILDAAMAKAKKAKIKAQGLHRENQLAAAGIVDAAKEYQADLIIIASHGRSGVHKLLLGSQTAEVMKMSELPVLVVK
ncbi:MAG: universal stress protein [Candidatus Tokpelaia sp.]|uniref:universal stress protein n=1 Tax=Candidatus Tokpelaia sp. TaxID=2233777 RepID=UPI001238F002|nr:universal stress protein [Candidatus Tokpelaia sp.]KAA6205374.1 MAG: universal stress protein [Candidatus Tokpelaia sp.]KAA6206807.1 MAG: universal stress protein [Candidatus Tokpelaia sp.]KAA6406206.1 universal stress protein [Candidatus Tokpelaia sp.]